MRHATPPGLLAFAAGLLAAKAVSAQAQAQQQPMVFASATSLVNVAVTVEDRQGRPIDGLSARDFVLREDGRAQTIEMCARMGEGFASRSTSLDVALLWERGTHGLAALYVVASVALSIAGLFLGMWLVRALS